MIAISSYVRTVHINSLCGRNAAYINVKPGGIQWRTEGGGLGCSNTPRNFEDISGVLHRMSKKNRRLDFLL